MLIEAKFWAGLTANQPGGYLKRLESAPQPSALLFVAPAQRLDSLWPELCRLSESVSDIALDSGGEGLQSARIGDGPNLMLTSWRNLLGRMAAKVSAAADSHTEIDIRQLQGLAEQQDKEAFLPLRQEELGPQLPRRVIDLTDIARHRDTPLWLWFWDTPADLRRMLEPLRARIPPELIGTGNRLSVPIDLPVGKERGEVLDAVEKRLREIARMITPER